jgi:splicing factor 3B subunit 3
MSTSTGAILALYPFDTREDIDFFIHLEMYLRVEIVPLSGREHILYRSSFTPCKVISKK